MEASMHRPADRSGNTDRTIYANSSLRFVVIPAILSVLMAALAMTQPDVSRWMMESVQAEFAPSGPLPEAAPTQLAQPAKETGSVKAN
jgi:hypothetical protein